jgi:hypothetical protein
MPIKAYLPTSGPVFGPETLGNMGKAFESAVTILGIDPRDEAKRTAVARFIIRLVEIEDGLDEATLRDKVVLALGGSTYVALASNDEQVDALGPRP